MTSEPILRQSHRLFDGRHHLDSMLRAQSLQRRAGVAPTDGNDRKLLTDYRLDYVAGCLFDTPNELEDLAIGLLAEGASLVTVGGGERAAHVARIAHECGCPTGVIAQVVASCEEMNSTVMSALLAPRGCFLPPCRSRCSPSCAGRCSGERRTARPAETAAARTVDDREPRPRVLRVRRVRRRPHRADRRREDAVKTVERKVYYCERFRDAERHEEYAW